MNTYQAFVLGILQGITEFLPISSSGHLVLGEHYLGLNVAALKSFDVAVHFGTLFAIIVYFWRDLSRMLMAFFAFCEGKLDKILSTYLLPLWEVLETMEPWNRTTHLQITPLLY